MSDVPRRVVITGASSGIGQATAQLLCADGATVINLDVQPGTATAARCGSAFTTIHTDMGDVASVRAAFVQADAVFGGAPPDLLVCCAAVSKAHHILDAEPVDVDRLLAVNVRGTLLACQEAGRRMRRAGHGHIVVITSVAAVTGWAQEPIYCVTKGAQLALVQALAVELAPYGILVNAVGPGPIEAPPGPAMVHTRGDESVLRYEIDRTPLGRFGRPEEIAQAVRFLADVTWMTGQTIYVDGGFLATGLAYLGAARAALPPAGE